MSETAAGLYLEDFARSGVDAELAHLSQQPAFATIRERLLEEGRIQGRHEAEQRYAAERRALIDGPLSALERLLGGLEGERSAFQQENERELLALALAIARRLLRTELRANPAVLEGKLRELLQLLDQESSYRVLVNPEDLAAVSALLEQEGQRLFGALPFQFKPDRRLPAGSVALEGDRGRVESIAAVELDRMEALLEGAVTPEDDDAL